MTSTDTRRRRSTAHWYGIAFALFVLPACQDRRQQVVVYCAHDREFSEPVLDRFEQVTGIDVLAKYDTESTKSVGLAQQILREQSSPICDVFWNNEIVNTIRLAEAGALDSYESSVGRVYPATYRSPKGLWYGFAARVRVLLVNTELVNEDERPHTMEDLTQPQWRGKVGIAKPLFGTTATHAACLFAVLGPEKARDLFLRLKANEIRVLSGNKQVAVDVGAGRLAIGLTDTDDSLAELRAGRPVRIAFFGQDGRGHGMLSIPNTVSVLRGAPHAENARRLVDFLLSPEVETELALGKSGQIPLHPMATAQPNLQLPANPKQMKVDFTEAVRMWDTAMEFIKNEFTAP